MRKGGPTGRGKLNLTAAKEKLNHIPLLLISLRQERVTLIIQQAGKGWLPIAIPYRYEKQGKGRNVPAAWPFSSLSINSRERKGFDPPPATCSVACARLPLLVARARVARIPEHALHKSVHRIAGIAAAF